jgi:hypothetical protein
MSWVLYHSESERFASTAEMAAKHGEHDRAVELYKLAAEAEARALNEVDPKKSRTLGVTAVSVAALHYKAGEYEDAKDVAQKWLNNDVLPDFAGEQLRDILRQIDAELDNKPKPLKGNGRHSSAKPRVVREESNLTVSNIGERGKVNALSRFLWFCGGGEVSILSRPECITERTKYAGLGAITLSSTLLAVLSAGYVATLAFNSVSIATFIAMLWGVIIFSINRFFYNFSKDNQSIRRQLNWILPRLLITVLISFVTAKPITIKLFEKELQSQIARNFIELNRDMSVQALNDPEIIRLQAENESLRRELEGLERRREQLQTQLLAETVGNVRDGRTGMAGQGPVYQVLKSQLDQITSELEEQRRRVNAAVETNNIRINQLRQRLDQDFQREAVNSSPSLLAYIEALGQLSQSNRAVVVADWSITLLFILLGLSPMLMQLLSERGPYGYILKRIEHEVMLREQREMLNLDMQTYIDAEVNREIKMMMLGTALHTDEVLDITSIRAEYTPKLAAEMNKRLRERLEVLKDVPSSEEVSTTDRPS